MKLLVIVPYRDRASHLKEFIPYITNALHSQSIDYKIVVIEQSSEKLFNRGLLCNIGFELYQKECDYICIHDVDIIGQNFDYSYEPVVTHLSARWEFRDYQEFYSRCLGGVVLFPKEDFIKINGFSNEYWGWGAEDDDLRLRCDIKNLEVQRKQGRFHSLPHKKIEMKDRPQKSAGYIDNVQRLSKFRSQNYNQQLQTLQNDGLNNVKNYYSIKKISLNKDYQMVSTIVT
jgi:predicted glycosyltransferase involved in capsule biosynthesis